MAKRKTTRRKPAKRKPTKRKTATTKNATSKKTTPTKRKRGRPKKAATKPPANGADGGQGDNAAEPAPLDESRGKTTRSDLRMIERAARKRWNTRPDIKDALLAKVARAGLESDNARVIVAATRCYLVAESQNQGDELKGIPDKIQVEHVAHAVGSDEQRTAILSAVGAEMKKRRIRGPNGKN